MEQNQRQDKLSDLLKFNFKIRKMKKILIYTLVIFMTTSCGELTDFTAVENPNLSETSVVGQLNSSRIWLSGMERQLSNVINEVVINAELTSDNYMNDQTFYNQFLDGLNVTNNDNDVEDFQFALHRLREMGSFGLNSVGPGDPNYEVSTEAEYNFFIGMSSLYSGMYFIALPDTQGEAPTGDKDNIRNAISSFDAAIALNPKAEYHLAKARGNYLLGNRAEAMSSASAALALSPDFTRFARFDQTEGPVNVMESALFQRGSFDDLQPLPTLDFLDPKYSFESAAEDPSVHYLKAEEAMMINIEGMIAGGDLSGAKTMMSDLLALIQTRPVKTFDDSVEGRTHFAPGTRPDSDCDVVNGRSGLVLDRLAGPVSIPEISGTSMTQADIDAVSTENEALYLLYRTRQEVFIAEGLRMVDMGVKLIVGLTEQLINDNVSEDGVGTMPQVPSYFASVSDKIDAIVTDTICTTTTVIDVTQILVDNKGDELVMPFN